MLRLIAIAMIAIVINALIFTLIERLVGSERVRLTDAENVQVANFIRMTEESREIRSRRDAKAPEKPAENLAEDLSQLANASTASGSGMMAFDVPQFDVDPGPADAGDVRIAREINPLVPRTAELSQARARPEDRRLGAAQVYGHRDRRSRGP